MVMTDITIKKPKSRWKNVKRIKIANTTWTLFTRNWSKIVRNYKRIKKKDFVKLVASF